MKSFQRRCVFSSNVKEYDTAVDFDTGSKVSSVISGNVSVAKEIVSIGLAMIFLTPLWYQQQRERMIEFYRR